MKTALILLWFFPVSNFSVLLGRVFLGWTGTEQRIKCFAHGHNAVPLVRLKPATWALPLSHHSSKKNAYFILWNGQNMKGCNHSFPYAYLKSVGINIVTFKLHCNCWEHSGSVVECLTRDWRPTGLNLTGVTVLCPLAWHINPSLVLVQPRKTRPNVTERFLTGA